MVFFLDSKNLGKMMDYHKYGTTQKLMAKMAGNLNNSTISRWISKLNIEPLEKTSERIIKNIRYSIENVRALLKQVTFQDVNSSCKVISFYNFKGGTGKTSICYQISAHLALMGFNVLVVDADPQAHLSTSFGFDMHHENPTLYDIINGTIEASQAIKPVYQGLDCIPSNLALTRSEVVLNDLPKREERVRINLENLKCNYDFIVFDTNPTISILNRNILVFSDLVNIVCETQPYSLNGLKMLMEDMTRFYKNMQMNMPEILVIPNKYEDRSSSSAEAMTALRQYYPMYIIPDFAVRRSEDINTSAKSRLPLAFFARTNSIAFEDIIDLSHAILSKLGTKIDYKEVA